VAATGEPAVPLPPEPPAEDAYDTYGPPPVAPEDDVADFDDPDVDDDGMSTHELLARELGATVIEETRNG
jgi:DNA polymerase-3 subunit gamma/tau